MSRQSGLAFAANQLPALPADKVYQLWVVPQDRPPVNAGLLSPDASGHASLFFEMPADLPPPAVLAVTVEPAGGVPAPTGDKVLVGSRAGRDARARSLVVEPPPRHPSARRAAP